MPRLTKHNSWRPRIASRIASITDITYIPDAIKIVSLHAVIMTIACIMH